MTQGKNRGGRPTNAKAPWGELYRKMGGQSKLADALGVSTSTITKWAREVHRVPELAKKELLRLCKRYGVTEGIERIQSLLS